MTGSEVIKGHTMPLSLGNKLMGVGETKYPSYQALDIIFD